MKSCVLGGLKCLFHAWKHVFKTLHWCHYNGQIREAGCMFSKHRVLGPEQCKKHNEPEGRNIFTTKTQGLQNIMYLITSHFLLKDAN